MRPARSQPRPISVFLPAPAATWDDVHAMRITDMKFILASSRTSFFFFPAASFCIRRKILCHKPRYLLNHGCRPDGISIGAVLCLCPSSEPLSSAMAVFAHIQGAAIVCLEPASSCPRRELPRLWPCRPDLAAHFPVEENAADVEISRTLQWTSHISLT